MVPKDPSSPVAVHDIVTEFEVLCGKEKREIAAGAVVSGRGRVAKAKSPELTGLLAASFDFTR